MSVFIFLLSLAALMGICGVFLVVWHILKQEYCVEKK